MNRWQELFKDHQIHETLDRLEALANKDFDDISEAELDERKRFIKIINIYREILNALDPEVIPFNQLDGLNNQLVSGNIMGQVTHYSNSQNPNHLKAANDHVTNQLTQLCLFKALVDKAIEQPTSSSSLEYGIKKLIEQKDKLKSEYKEIEQNSQSIADRLEELKNTSEDRRKQIENILADWQQQFSDSQSKRAESYSEWRRVVEEEIQLKAQELRELTKSKTDELKESTKEELEQLISDSKDKHKQILELYDLASGDSISGGYAQTSQNEGKKAFWWQVLSYLFIIFTVAWLIIAYINFSGDSSQPECPAETKQEEPVCPENNKIEPFNWSRYFVSLSLTGVLLFGAGYAGRQASNHRDIEKRTRWFSLQVKALDPYLSQLDETTRNELKVSLANNFFKGVDLESNNKDSEKETSNLLQNLIDLMKQAKK